MTRARRLAGALLAAGALGVLGCSGADRDRERRGDEAYAAGRHAAALADYRAALGGSVASGGDDRLLAKAGLAALRSGDLGAAAESYTRLADVEPSRGAEAAEGLEQVARAAVERGDARALAAAVDGVRRLEPARPVGRYAFRAARGRAGETGLDLLPVAVAAAPDPGSQDSLLAAWGNGLRRASACERASLVFEAVRRRQEAGDLREAADDGLADCAWRLGRAALEANDPVAAAGWLGRVAGLEPGTERGRRALLDLGRIRAAQGDTAGAVAALGAAIAEIPEDESPDEVSLAAQAELDRLGPAAPPAGEPPSSLQTEGAERTPPSEP